MINAVDHAERLGGYQIAGKHPHSGFVQRRVRNTGGKPTLNCAAHQCDSRLDHFQRRGVGDAAMTRILAREAARGERSIDLGSRTVDQHHAHTQHRQQREIMDDVHQVGVLNAITTEHDHERLTAMFADVRSRRAKPPSIGG